MRETVITEGVYSIYITFATIISNIIYMYNINLFIERLLSSDNDSAKPLSLIASIYRYLMVYFGLEPDIVSARGKMVNSLKKALENPVSQTAAFPASNS